MPGMHVIPLLLELLQGWYLEREPIALTSLPSLLALHSQCLFFLHSLLCFITWHIVKWVNEYSWFSPSYVFRTQFLTTSKWESYYKQCKNSPAFLYPALQQASNSARCVHRETMGCSPIYILSPKYLHEDHIGNGELQTNTMCEKFPG